MFTNKAAYEAALAKSGQSLGARYLDIKEAQGSQRAEPSVSRGKYITKEASSK